MGLFRDCGAEMSECGKLGSFQEPSLMVYFHHQHGRHSRYQSQIWNVLVHYQAEPPFRPRGCDVLCLSFQLLQNVEPSAASDDSTVSERNILQLKVTCGFTNSSRVLFTAWAEFNPCF